jgi:CCR4-NOT transcription complex subunit 1
LAKSLLNEPKPSLQNFAAGLIRECLTCDPPLASQSGFQYTIEVLGQIVQANKATDEYVDPSSISLQNVDYSLGPSD